MFPSSLKFKHKQYLLLIFVASISLVSGKNQANANRTQLKSNHDFQLRFPFNHRMDFDDESPSTNSTQKTRLSFAANQDRSSADSILRPQLALQIFTNSANHRNQHHEGTEEEAFLRSASGRAGNLFEASRGTDGMLMMSPQPLSEPIQQLEARGHKEATGSKFGSWHYITDQQNQQPLPFVEVTSSEPSEPEPTNNNKSPLINAIISLPSSSNHQHRGEHNKNNMSFPGQELNLDGTERKQTNGGEHSLGNIELSMNVNGEEIVINPAFNVNRRERVERQKRKGMRPKQLVSTAEDNLGKGLRKHAEPVEVDEQSASEIDLVDNVENNNPDDIDPEEDLDQELARSLLDEDAEQQERLRERKLPRSGRRDSSSGSPESEEETRLESSQRPSSQEREDSEGKRKRQFRRVVQTKHSNSRITDSNLAREASSSRRKATHKTEDNQRVVRDEVSPVLIKGEDVRRFEQLLENLRSLQMDNLGAEQTEGVRRTNRQSKQTNLKLQVDADNNYEKVPDSDDGDASTSNQDNKQPSSDSDRESDAIDFTSQDRAPNNSRLSQSGSSSSPTSYSRGEKSDCDKLRHKGGSSSVESDKTQGDRDGPLSSSVSDHEQMTNNEADDLNGDDSNHNTEQEEISGDEDHDEVVEKVKKYSYRRPYQEQQKLSVIPLADSNTIDDQPRNNLVRTLLREHYDKKLRHSSTRNQGS